MMGAKQMAGANTLTFTEDSFEDDVLKSDQPVLVDFWAEWCMPCKALGPIIDQLAEEYQGKVRVGKCDTDANQGVAASYQISSIPTVILFHNGEIKEKFVGLRQKKDYAAVIDGLLG
jgi:thioredoxin 1